MGTYYRAEIHITKQEDGLWRLFVPGMQGAWTDCRTLEEGFSDLQEVIALAIDYYREHGWPLPESMTAEDGPPTTAILPILCEEYRFVTPAARSRKSNKA